MPCDWSSDVCRSEEHTSELQSHDNLVCRLLLEKKKHAVCLVRSHASCSAPQPLARFRRRAVGCRQPSRGVQRGVVPPYYLLYVFFFLKIPRPPSFQPLSRPGPFPT